MRSGLSGMDTKSWQYFNMIRTLICALLFSVAVNAGAGTAKSDRPHASEYRNENYGYAVRIPVGVKLETSKPPNPNHGFGIKLTPTTLLWVDASYTDDDSLHAVVMSERQTWGDTCQGLTTKPVLLGKLPAERMTLKCVDKTKGNAPTIVTLVVAVLSRPHNGTIKYEISSQGPLPEGASVNTQQMFSRIAEGFYLIPSE